MLIKIIDIQEVNIANKVIKKITNLIIIHPSGLTVQYILGSSTPVQPIKDKHAAMYTLVVLATQQLHIFTNDLIDRHYIDRQIDSLFIFLN